MSEHAEALVAFGLALLCLALAFAAGGLHFSPRVHSPLGGAATALVSTVFVVLASLLLVWGLISLGYHHVG